MKRKSNFKYVFWGLLTVMVLLVIAVASLFLSRMPGAVPRLVLLLPLIIFLPAYVILVGRLVYVDAEKREMDPWLWTTVAVFVPYLIGVIIYLIMRLSIKNTCITCGKGIEKDFKICPYCGQNQEMVCENCKKAVLREWNVCPYCAHPLSGGK